MVEKKCPSIDFFLLDGCVSQFKLHKAQYFVGHYPNLTSGCAMISSFFGTGHGKGAHDGIGVVIKSFLWQE
jgi:hypothetical protein